MLVDYCNFLCECFQCESLCDPGNGICFTVYVAATCIYPPYICINQSLEFNIFAVLIASYICLLTASPCHVVLDPLIISTPHSIVNVSICVPISRAFV